MSYFVEIFHDTGSYNGHYNLFEVDAWERYEQEIINNAEAGDFHTILIGKDDINRIAKYDFDEDTYDDYLDIVADKIATLANKRAIECEFEKIDS